MSNNLLISNLISEANARQLRAQISYGNTNPTLFLRSDGTWAPAGSGGGAVDSVNGRTGAVTLSKSDVGLSNVDNTSDLNKPISNAVATALDNKQPLSTVLTNTTASFTTALESKLAGIQDGALNGEGVDDRVASLLVAGSNITITYNDFANTLTIAATGGGGSGNTYFPSGWS